MTHVEPPSNIDVILAAPKGSGRTVEIFYSKKRGINSSHTLSGTMLPVKLKKRLTLPVLVLVGHRTTFEEVNSGFIWGTWLGGTGRGMFLAQYEVLRENGHTPSEAFNETVEEATQSLYPLIGKYGMDYMYDACSTTARRCFGLVPKIQRCFETSFRRIVRIC